MIDLDWILDDDREPVTAIVQLAEPELVDDAGRWARRASALLATVADPLRRADLRELFEERAGVCEYCGELDRDDAERIAFGELRDAMQESRNST